MQCLTYPLPWPGSLGNAATALGPTGAEKKATPGAEEQKDLGAAKPPLHTTATSPPRQDVAEPLLPPVSPGRPSFLLRRRVRCRRGGDDGLELSDPHPTAAWPMQATLAMQA
jgi:hypothetical protein